MVAVQSSASRAEASAAENNISQVGLDEERTVNSKTSSLAGAEEAATQVQASLAAQRGLLNQTINDNPKVLYDSAGVEFLNSKCQNWTQLRKFVRDLTQSRRALNMTSGPLTEEKICKELCAWSTKVASLTESTITVSTIFELTIIESTITEFSDA